MQLNRLSRFWNEREQTHKQTDKIIKYLFFFVLLRYYKINKNKLASRYIPHIAGKAEET